MEKYDCVSYTINVYFECVFNTLDVLTQKQKKQGETHPAFHPCTECSI